MLQLIEDYRCDWRRWSRAERIAAIALLAFFLLGAAAALAASGPHTISS